MSGGRNTFKRSLGVLSGALLMSISARADVYHPVVGGETLASIASKYHVSTNDLRAANGLSDSDSANLSSMLLRVPGADARQIPLSAPQASTMAPISTPRQSSGNSNSLRGGGLLASAVYETVRPGDTWESIAARYRAAGNDVTTESLRGRNANMSSPIVGQNIVVPLGQITYQSPAVNYAPRVDLNAPVGRSGNAASITPTYSASAQTVPPTNSTASEPRALGGGVYASGEFSAPSLQSDAPVARIIPNQTPIYNPLSAANANTTTPRRGALASRGGYGQLSRTAQGGEVRVLGQGEDANAPVVSGNSGDAVAATSQPVRPAGSIARVAQIKGNGARIRRLPQDAAATLYNCAVGTRLAVLRQSGAWSAVLMSDRSTGWVPTKYLSMTAQTVDVSAQIVATPGPGGSEAYAGNGYNGQSPYVVQALRWLGTRYVYGGTSRRGIDCSALVQNSFAAQGVRLPRTAAQQARVGVAVAPADLRSGDRLYFSASGTRIDHTGLYMGNGLFVHASGSGRKVMVSNLFAPRNWNIFVGGRR